MPRSCKKDSMSCRKKKYYKSLRKLRGKSRSRTKSARKKARSRWRRTIGKAPKECYRTTTGRIYCIPPKKARRETDICTKKSKKSDIRSGKCRKQYRGLNKTERKRTKKKRWETDRGRKSKDYLI